MVASRQERKPADQIPIGINPICHQYPFVFSHRDGNGRIVFGIIFFDQFPMFELVEGGQVILANRAFRRFDRKFQNESGGVFEGLSDFGIIRHALVFEHFKQRISAGNPNTADVVRRVPRMHARSAIHRLRHRAGRLDASYASRLRYQETLGVFLVHFDGKLFQLFQNFRVSRRGRIPLPCNRDTEQPFFFAIFLPFRR